MKPKAYIVLLLSVLILSLPIATYANVQIQGCEMSCCNNSNASNECKDKKEDSKGCCGSKSHCNCMVSVAVSAFVFQDNTWLPKSVLPLVERKYEHFAFSFPASVSFAVWQPPKFLF